MHRQRLDLDRSKVNPDAQAWATAESDQRIGCPFVLLAWWGKTFGIEHPWIGKDTGQMMACSQGQAHRCASWQDIARKFHVPHHTAWHGKDRRVQSPCLLDHIVEDLHFPCGCYRDLSSFIAQQGSQFGLHVM